MRAREDVGAREGAKWLQNRQQNPPTACVPIKFLTSVQNMMLISFSTNIPFISNYINQYVSKMDTEKSENIIKMTTVEFP